MSEETKAVDNTANDALEAKFADLSGKFDHLVNLLENSQTAKRAKMVAPDSTTDNPSVKSLADFAIALKRGNHERLAKVYKSTQQEGDNGLGGYTVPEEFLAGIYSAGSMMNPITQLVNTINVGSGYGRMPVLDVYAAPGTGDTAFAGGMDSNVTAEAGTMTESNITFEELTWNLNKHGGIVPVTSELLADTAAPLESLLRDTIQKAVTAKNEYWILRGSGAGEPLGILNSSAAIAVNVDTDNTFVYADALEMTTRFKSMGGQATWIVHPSVLAEIGVFESTAGGGVWQANFTSAMGQSLLGYPIVISEFMPGQGGDRVILADLSAYRRFAKGGVSLAYSEHVYFATDRVGWRFTERVDGKPWMRTAITLSDGAGTYTVSPFVYLND